MPALVGAISKLNLKALSLNNLILNREKTPDQSAITIKSENFSDTIPVKFNFSWKLNTSQKCVKQIHFSAKQKLFHLHVLCFYFAVLNEKTCYALESMFENCNEKFCLIFNSCLSFMFFNISAFFEMCWLTWIINVIAGAFSYF